MLLILCVIITDKNGMFVLIVVLINVCSTTVAAADTSAVNAVNGNKTDATVIAGASTAVLSFDADATAVDSSTFFTDAAAGDYDSAVASAAVAAYALAVAIIPMRLLIF